MLGTLVVVLPSQYTGGDLVLQHQGHARRALWGVPLNSSPTLLRWIAFFGDVDHSVRPVQEGVRLTLSYILRRTTLSSLPLPPPPPTQMDALGTCLRTALADGQFLVKGGTLAVPCHHLYSKEDLFGKKSPAAESDTPLTTALVAKLKGRDALVASTVLNLGLDVTLHPYLVESCAFTRWHLSELPAANAAKKLGKRVDSDKLSRMFSAEQIGWGYDADEIWIEDPPSTSKKKNKKPRVDPSSAGKATEDEGPAIGHIHSCSYSEDGYFGNEASDTDFYLYLALHIEIPPLGEPPRVVIPAAAALPSSAEEGNKKT